MILQKRIFFSIENGGTHIRHRMRKRRLQQGGTQIITGNTRIRTGAAGIAVVEPFRFETENLSTNNIITEDKLP